jgi:outer membrane protein assembly factor BamB/tetratricopeptide (TPR) repeat protein
MLFPQSPFLHRCATTGVCLAVFLSAHARAQVPDAPAPTNKDTPAGVSVPDSPGAQERLDKARDKENQKQWKTAAEFYQEALTKYPDRTVSIKRDPDNDIYQYEGVAPLIQERLAKWPADAIKIYRQAYNQPAADLLTTTPRGDIAGLRTVFWNYFLTDAGKSAAMQLLDLYTESGDFRSAEWMGDRLLTLYPDLGTDRSTIVYRTALASHWAGDTEAAQRWLTELKQNGGNDIGTIAGKDTNLVESLSQILSAPAIAPTTRPTDAETYPSFGGSGGRGQLSHSTDNEPRASLAHIELTPPDFNGMMGVSGQQLKSADVNSLASNAAMGIMPVADNGSIFFQDGRCVYAVDEDTGAPLPGWLNTFGPGRMGRYRLSATGRARDELLTITVSPTAVLAVMGQPDHGSPINGGFNPNFVMQNVQQNSTIKLVCLDRDTGRELWTRSPADLPDSIAALKTAEYCGTPLVIPAALAGRSSAANSVPEDCVLVAARGGQQNQFDDCYIVCLSLATGQYRWSSYVGSATRVFDMEAFTSSQPTQMSLADGRVYVMTNLGTVAALDPADGRVLWLSAYDRDNSDNPEAMFLRARRFGQPGGMPVAGSKPWAHNPVYVDGGYVYVLPADSKKLFVYNESTGNREKAIPLTAFHNADLMLGIIRGGVCLTSENDLYVLDWQKYAEDADASTYIRWKRERLTAIDGKENSVVGRGFITADSIYIPSTQRIYIISIRSNKIVREIPSNDGTFTGEQGPGNLLVTAHNVIVAGQTRVDVYTNLDRVRQRFETAMAAAPNDPQPRMEYAEALFTGGQTADSLARVDEAINLIGGPTAMHSGKDRLTIFLQSLDFARRAWNGSTSPSSSQVSSANAYFDRALLTADTPAEKATCRLDRAKFNAAISEYVNAVKLCQEILSDDAMRNATLDNDISAAEAAEAAIAEAIHKSPGAYADIDLQAMDALQKARAGGDAQQLLAVAAIYPNSKAAADARVEAANRFEAANEPAKAIEVLRRIYLSYPDPVDRANVLVSIANDYLAMPNGLSPALDRICRAARISLAVNCPQKIRLPDGTVLGTTYQQVIEKLRQMQYDQENNALPDFHLGTPSGKQLDPFVPGEPPVIGNVTAILHPLRGFARYDQILTWSPAGLCIYPVGQTTPVAKAAGIDKPPLGAAVVHGNWVVWTKTNIYQLAGDGSITWSSALANLPAIAVATGRESAINDTGDNADQAVANNGQIQINGQGGGFVRVNGQLIAVPPGGAVNIRGLRRQMQMAGQPVPVPPVAGRPGDEEIVGVQPAGPDAAQLVLWTSTGRVAAIDTRVGQLLWQTRPADHAVDQLLANAHYTVVRIDDPTGSLLAVFDTPTGKAFGRRVFGAEGSPRQLVNAALSEDSMLALTLFNAVIIKDLYDPWKAAFIELNAVANRDSAPFVGLNQNDQVLIKAGRLACVYAGGQQARAYDLSKNADPSNPLQTETDTPAVTLQMVGYRLFIVTPSNMHQYGLQAPGIYPNTSGETDHFWMNNAVRFPPKVRALFLGRNHALVINDSVDRGPLGSPLMALVFLRRALVHDTTRASGNIDWVKYVSQPDSGITDWTCGEGSLYYLTRDNNLHERRGAAR